jgi:hypothetical protein
MSRLNSHKGSSTRGANFVVRDQFTFDDRAVFSRLDDARTHSYRLIGWRWALQRDRVVGCNGTRRFVRAGFLHQVPGGSPVAMTIEQRADDAAAQHAGERLILCARLPLGDNFITDREAADVQAFRIRGATTKTGKIRCESFLDAFVHLFCTLSLVLCTLFVLASRY